MGQMILARSDGVFLHEDHPEYRRLEELVAQGRVGGVVFFRGHPFSTAALANRLQDEARLPLLMASDYEWGAAFRVEGSRRFPTAMAIGAGGDEEDARFQAEVTASEARAMGIHLALAPVVDINLNPANSVINYRSYGEDPDRVGRLGAAFIRRAQDRGLLATAKHFPGHGATVADSHVTLPLVDLSRERVETVGLEPFRAAIEAGVAAVMTAHVAVPALDGRSDRPATFSPEILTGVLRNELGFDGLIISDALDMGGVERWWGGEVAVAAVDAGVDLLAVPADALVAWDGVVRAVDLGFILLGEILERISGRAFEELVREEVLEPLEMTSTVFNPPPSLRDSTAPTEDDPWRGRLVQGEVHDENAFVMGGVAPHAGLFSTASDLARFAQAMLNGGIYGTRRIMKRSTIERFTRQPNLVPESARALGWDTPSSPSSSGRYFSPTSFGHLGFTGTSLWIDPERQIFVILLTNRVHPRRDNRGIRDVRPDFHDAVMEALALVASIAIEK